MKLTLLYILIFSSPLAKDMDIERFAWEGIDVAYIEDNRFPTYTISFFFADGALSDGRVKGVTKGMFDLLTAGTRRFSQKDIEDNLEFYGLKFSNWVAHDFSVYNFSGLAKDVLPTMKKICHLFADASYPNAKLRRYKKVRRAHLQSLINSPESLANRIFRRLVFERTPYEYPVGGRIVDVKKWKMSLLKERRRTFNTQVKKKVYLTGPRPILKIKNVLLRECGWNPKADFIRRAAFKKKERGPRLVFATMPKGNQAQIRIGRSLTPSQTPSPELARLTSTYLGHGFRSLLMEELRNKRGLTYSAFVTVIEQKEYGMGVIQTATKNASIKEVVKIIHNIIDRVGKRQVSFKRLEEAKERVAGSYPFQFEDRSEFLYKLMMLDHKNRSFREFQRFPKKVKAIRNHEAFETIEEIFRSKKQTVLILGNKKLIRTLKALGKLKIVPYSKYL